jgi:hypothetical protein
MGSDLTDALIDVAAIQKSTPGFRRLRADAQREFCLLIKCPTREHNAVPGVGVERSDIDTVIG